MLENCTQLTSVNFFRCEKITGGSCFGECSFSRLRLSPLFLGEHSLQKNPRTSTNGSQQFESINQLLRAGDIQVLASCPNLTKVDMECTKVEGTNERLNVSALFLEEISSIRILREISRVARRTCRNFLEISSLPSKSLAHSHLPCLLVNPIPHRRHPSAGKVYATDERQLLRLHENHRWVLLRGTFFLQVAAQVRFFLEEFFSIRILR